MTLARDAGACAAGGDGDAVPGRAEPSAQRGKLAGYRAAAAIASASAETVMN